MTPEQMQEIMDNAPNESEYYCTNVNVYHLCDDLLSYQCCINLQDLRNQLAKHEPMDLRDVDTPHGKIVLEK